FHKPAKAVGGDYYDVIHLGNGRFGIVIADVSGKGISAAILMAGVRAQIRILVKANLSPQEIVERVNAALVSETNSAQFITLFYGVLDTTNLRIEYVNAGHNPPFVVGADGKITILDTGGIPVGSFPDATFDTGVVNLSPGDRVVLYTDGVTEAGDPATSHFDDDALRELVIDNRTQDEKQIIELVMKKVDSLNSRRGQSDDVTLLVFRTLP
ncbi:MAG: PP2C family protein-serine/threonine phosphatase, partial [candidate division Zixibacteria bacterium]|nr:PP2C family protein-serine/threonine phosphatase [candidate division Zixibacteria bacterium]